MLFEVGIIISARVMKSKEKEHDDFMKDEPSTESQATT
jgi:hypothetical protein